jgi:hypothetical protein
MAYTLQKGFEEVTSRLGRYDSSTNNWRLGNSQTVRYMHSPLSNVMFVRNFFEYQTEYSGSKRTPNVAVSFHNVPKHLQN